MVAEDPGLAQGCVKPATVRSEMVLEFVGQSHHYRGIFVVRLDHAGEEGDFWPPRE